MASLKSSLPGFRLLTLPHQRIPIEMLFEIGTQAVQQRIGTSPGSQIPARSDSQFWVVRELKVAIGTNSTRNQSKVAERNVERLLILERLEVKRLLVQPLCLFRPKKSVPKLSFAFWIFFPIRTTYAVWTSISGYFSSMKRAFHGTLSMWSNCASWCRLLSGKLS
jgi:hypothetical protein